jgi:hypothetical protein
LLFRSIYCLSFRIEAKESAVARSTTVFTITENALAVPCVPSRKATQKHGSGGSQVTHLQRIQDQSPQGALQGRPRLLANPQSVGSLLVAVAESNAARNKSAAGRTVMLLNELRLRAKHPLRIGGHGTGGDSVLRDNPGTKGDFEA